MFPGLYVGPKPKTRRPRASQPADEDADEYVPPDAARQWSVELTDQQKQAWDSITEQAADKAFANLRSYLPTTRHKAKARWANLKLDWNQQLPPAEVKQWSNNILEAFRQQTADALILGGSCYFYINGKALKYVSRNDSAEGCVKGLGDAAVELDLQALVPSNNAASPQNSWQCSFDVAVQYSVGNQYTTWRISALQDALSQFGGRFLSDASRMPMHLTYDLGGVQSNTSSWVEKTLG